MAELTFETVGGGEGIVSMFQGIAHVTSTDNYLGFLTVFMLIGFAIAVGKATTGNVASLFKWSAAAMLIGILMLGPKSSIVVHDSTDPGLGPNRVTDVPLALVLVASVSSNINYALVNMLETAMSTPGDLEYSKTGMIYGSKLARSTGFTEAVSKEFQTNMQVYIKDCVLMDATPNYYSIDMLAQSKNLWKTLKTDFPPNPALTTSWRTLGNTELINCQQALDKMDSLFAGQLDATSIALQLKLANRKLSDTEAKNKFNLQASEVASAYYGMAKDGRELLRQGMLINGFIGAVNEFSGVGGNTQVQAYMQTKASIQSGYSQQTAAALMEEYIPLANIVLVALLIGTFPIVVALSFIPGMMNSVLPSYIGGFAVLMLWGPLFVIINHLMTVYGIASVQAAQSAGDGSLGLSLFNFERSMSTNARLSTIAGYMTLMVPVIATALTKGGIGMVSGQTETLLRPITSASEAAASEAASGNFSVGNAHVGNDNAYNSSLKNTQLKTYSANTVSENLINANKINTNHAVSMGEKSFINEGGNEIRQLAGGAVVSDTRRGRSHYIHALTSSSSLGSVASKRKESAQDRVSSITTSLAETDQVRSEHFANEVANYMSGNDRSLISDKRYTESQTQALDKASGIVNSAMRNEGQRRTIDKEVRASATGSLSSGKPMGKPGGNVSGAVSGSVSARKSDFEEISAMFKGDTSSTARQGYNESMSRFEQDMVSTREGTSDTKASGWNAAVTSSKEQRRALSSAQNDVERYSEAKEHFERQSAETRYDLTPEIDSINNTAYATGEYTASDYAQAEKDLSNPLDDRVRSQALDNFLDNKGWADQRPANDFANRPMVSHFNGNRQQFRNMEGYDYNRLDDNTDFYYGLASSVIETERGTHLGVDGEGKALPSNMPSVLPSIDTQKENLLGDFNQQVDEQNAVVGAAQKNVKPKIGDRFKSFGNHFAITGAMNQWSPDGNAELFDEMQNNLQMPERNAQARRDQMEKAKVKPIDLRQDLAPVE
ncbi:MAG: hypothetical protein COA43_00720 [Robiginitomaculum sp.]|nr:MAG: hypothetical protein COA43_00720 [Robiginitomaculum sp.]